MDYKRILHTRLQARPFFNQCSDCHGRDPTWCSVNFSVFLCTRCASLHKQLLNREPYVSQIKSIVLDRWTANELDQFCGVNNRQAEAVSDRLYCTTNNAYDLEMMVKNKYIKPIVELAHRQEERSHHVYTGRRRARDFELSRYGTQIRQIQNHSTNYYSIDNIVEALLLANGDSRQAYDILMREDDHGNNYHAAGAATATARLENAPQLPTRPSNVIKPAVFDGTNVITSSPYAQGTNVSNLTEPRPAVFDGTMDLSQSGVVNPQFQQSNVNQYGMMQPGIQQGIQQGIQPMMTQNTAPLPQQPMIQPMLTQNTAPVPQQPMLTQNTAPVPQQPMMTQNTAPQQYMFQQNQQTSQQYPYSQTYMMPNYPQ